MTDATIKILLLSTGVLYLIAITGALAGQSKQHRFYLWSNLAALPATLLSGVAAFLVITGRAKFEWDIPGPLDWIHFYLKLDSLSAFFLLVFSLLAAMVTVYALGYRSHLTRSQAVFQPLFLASITGLLCAFDVMSFLFCWELMSFASYFLIVAQTDNAEQKKAGFRYLLMTQFGTVFIMIAVVGLAAVNGNGGFASLSSMGMSGAVQAWLLLCLLVGFGTKAGIVPLHIWLPQAHPAAPTPVSALLSGFMIKTAVYGLLRFSGFFEIKPWFGTVVLIMGAVTALLGILYAFMENDTKKLLAYCSIENMGIIFLVMGVYFWGRAMQNELLIGLALVALELHLLNHAFFKGLLFMSAGAMMQECGTRNIEKMGGLIRRMPQTGLLTLIGCMTGAGLPFTSGFVSEWLIFQTLFLTGMMVGTAWVKLIAFLGVATLALTAGIAVATFVKLFGVAFLALPRSPLSKSAKEVNRPMLAGMGLAAAGCVLLGISPWLGLALILPGVRQLGISNIFYTHPLLGIMTVNNAVSPAIALVLVGVMARIALWFLSRARWKTGPTWNCGTALQPQMEYSGTSFAKMGRLAFRFILRPKRQVVEQSRTNRLFPGPLEYRSELPSHFEEKLYQPGTKLVLWLSEKIRLLQTGSIKLYLGYILAVLIVLLLYLRLGY